AGPEPPRRPPPRPARAAVLVRPPLRRRQHPPCPRGLPTGLPPLRGAERALRDARRGRALRRHRGAGPLAGRAGIPGLPPPPPGPAGPLPDPRGGCGALV